MKVYWDDMEHKLVIDLEGKEFRADFESHPVNQNIVVKNGVFIQAPEKERICH